VAELLTLSVSINMVRLRHGHQRLQPAQTEAAASLVVAIARAYTWQQLLLSGAYRSVQHLATSLGCDASYVAHTLNLALLAPDIIEAIVQGLPALTLKTMPKTIPMDWDAQRIMLGIHGGQTNGSIDDTASNY
jgi:hypothetical protein